MTFLARHLALDLRPGSAVTQVGLSTWAYLLPDLAPARVEVVGDVPEGTQDTVDRLRDAGGDGPPLVVVGEGPTADRARALVAGRHEGTAVVHRPHAAQLVRGPVARLASVEASGPAHDGGGRVIAVPGLAAAPSKPARAVTRARRVAGRDVRDPDAPTASRLSPGPARDGDTVVVLAADGSASGPPAYVRAAGAGDRLGWSLLAPVPGPTRSAVFLPADADGTVVRVATEACAVAELAHEAAVLEQLGRDPRLVPQVAELRGHSSRGPFALLARSYVPGEAFRDAATGTPVGPMLGSALDALHRLAALTVRRDPVDVRSPFAALVTAFVGGFGDGPVADRLRSDAAAVERVALPTCLVHGDIGPDHVLVHDGARISFVDWGHAELVGPPVWDLTQLLLTDVEMWLARRGRPVTGRSVAKHLFGRGDWQHRLQREVARSCGELGFPTHVGWALVRLLVAALACRDLPELAADRTHDSLRFQLLSEVVRDLDDRSAAGGPVG